MSALPAPPTARTGNAIAWPVSAGTMWLVAPVLLAVIIYYFIGVDQGAASVFGNDMHVHEFVHDARHFLGFPCH